MIQVILKTWLLTLKLDTNQTWDHSGINKKKQAFRAKKEQYQAKQQESHDNTKAINTKMEPYLVKAQKYCKENPFPEDHRYRDLEKIQK